MHDVAPCRQRVGPDPLETLHAVVPVARLS